MSENNGFPTELERYHRQMLLPGFGEDVQRKLADSTVLVVGCGALGTVLASTLSRAGVGHLKIVDRDFIEMTNLQRQILFDESDVENAIPKAEAARQKINKVNSQVKVTPIVDDLNHSNIESLIEDCDLLIDGVDNFETRFLVNDVAVKHRLPYIYGGAVGTVGMMYPILPHTRGGETAWEQGGDATPCLRCIFEQTPPPGMNPTCDTAGVLGPTVSIVANYQATEVLKVLTGNWDALNRRMVHLDTWANTYRQLKVEKAYDVGECTCCKQGVYEFLEGKYASATTTLCGRNAVQLTQQVSDGNIDFEEIAQRLRSHGQVNANKFMVRAEITDNGEPYELTLFNDGRAIVKGTKYANTAKSIYAKYVGV